MSKQVQIRRGSATENDDFTGAPGEVTMDLTNKTLRVHDGQTPGGTALARVDNVAPMVMPDYTTGTQCSFYETTAAPECGYFEVAGMAYNNAGLVIELNGVEKIIATSANPNYSTSGFVMMPVSTGDTIRGISSYNNTGCITFYKLKQ